MRLGNPTAATKLRQQFDLVGKVDLDLSTTVLPVVDVGPEIGSKRQPWIFGFEQQAPLAEHGVMGVRHSQATGLVHVQYIVIDAVTGRIRMKVSRVSMVYNSGSEAATGPIFGLDMREPFATPLVRAVNAGVLPANLLGGSLANFKNESALMHTSAPGATRDWTPKLDIVLAPGDKLYCVTDVTQDIVRGVFLGYDAPDE